MGIFLVLAIPLILAGLSLIIKKDRIFGVINSLGYLVVLVASFILLKDSIISGNILVHNDLLYIDTLSAFFIFVISIVAFATALYSIGYIEKDLKEGKLSTKKVKIYYVLFNLLCLAMLFAPAANNLGMLWVTIEMTTLVSAFLVGFYNSKESVEAAWKYIIICSVGIIFALLGTILFSYAFSLIGNVKSLNWSDMVLVSSNMNKNMIKIAFIFILVGYGTKAGLAPMHTWLPDAHSQAVAPISALLSGVLLKIAIYAILRFGIIVIENVGFPFFGNLLILFGIISMAIPCVFILVQKDLKRLLAYSSIEHVGMISIGFGLGSPLALAGAIFHIYNHAVAKSLMFFGAGNIVGYYKKHNMNAIRGVMKVLPFTGIMVLLGVFALTGFPPFSLFISEILIIIAAFTKGSYVLAAFILIFLSIVFGAFIYHFAKILFGNLPKGMTSQREPISHKLAFLFLFIQLCAVGVLFIFFNKDVIWVTQRLFKI